MAENNLIETDDGSIIRLPPDVGLTQVLATGEARSKRGRKRVDDPRNRVLRIRCTDGELENIDRRAKETGHSIGSFLRAAGLGQSGPRAMRRPTIEREQLGQLLGELGKVGSNINQIAKRLNATGDKPSILEIDEMKADIARIRGLLMGALSRGD